MATNLTEHQQRAATARAVMVRNSARRAVDDPAQLARAARIVRVALERGALTIDDLRGDTSEDRHGPTDAA